MVLNLIWICSVMTNRKYPSWVLNGDCRWMQFVIRSALAAAPIVKMGVRVNVELSLFNWFM